MVIRELYETIDIDARLALFKASIYLPLMLSLSSVWLFCFYMLLGGHVWGWYRETALCLRIDYTEGTFGKLVYIMGTCTLLVGLAE